MLPTRYCRKTAFSGPLPTNEGGVLQRHTVPITSGRPRTSPPRRTQRGLRARRHFCAPVPSQGNGGKDQRCTRQVGAPGSRPSPHPSKVLRQYQTTSEPPQRGVRQKLMLRTYSRGPREIGALRLIARLGCPVFVGQLGLKWVIPLVTRCL